MQSRLRAQFTLLTVLAFREKTVKPAVCGGDIILAFLGPASSRPTTTRNAERDGLGGVEME